MVRSRTPLLALVIAMVMQRPKWLAFIATVTLLPWIMLGVTALPTPSPPRMETMATDVVIWKLTSGGHFIEYAAELTGNVDGVVIAYVVGYQEVDYAYSFREDADGDPQSITPLLFRVVSTIELKPIRDIASKEQKEISSRVKNYLRKTLPDRMPRMKYFDRDGIHLCFKGMFICIRYFWWCGVLWSALWTSVFAGSIALGAIRVFWNRCAFCGYDRTGIDTTKCPECGRMFCFVEPDSC